MANTVITPSWTLRKVLIRVLIMLLTISGVMMLASYTTTVTRELYLVTFGWLVMTLLVISWQATARRKWVRVVGIGAMAACVAWMIFGGRPFDAERLRAAYLARLRSFAGVHYFWGGETHTGIDCSGLARTALMEAMVQRGIEEGNPRLLGPLLWRFWWHDLSANAMGNCDDAYTFVVDRTPELATYSHAWLQPGDLAVAAGGSHVLIYLGNRQWIEANPEDGKVVINSATTGSERAYFHQRMVLLRWWVWYEADSMFEYGR